MNHQYTNIDLSLISKDGLDYKEALVFSILSDRMKSSRIRPAFYDKKMQDSFIIFTIAEMASVLKISKRTVGKIYASLCDKGFMKKKKVFNSADHLFLINDKNDKSGKGENISKENKLHYSSAKVSRPVWKLLQPNHLNLITKSKTNTNNTSNTRNISQNEKCSLDKPMMNAVKSSLINIAKIPERSVNFLESMSFGSYERLHEFGSLIFKAKKKCEREATKSIGSQGYEALRFENNQYLCDGLYSTLERSIPRVLKTGSKTWSAYIFTSLYNFFGEAANEWLSAQKSLPQLQ